MARTKGARDWDYPEKRAAILGRVTAHLTSREVVRPSMRQLSDAAGISLSTLRHYFPSRSEMMVAVLEAQCDRAARGLPPEDDDDGLAGDVEAFSVALLGRMEESVAGKADDVLAVGLAEGLLDPELGPVTLRTLLEPSLQVLSNRFSTRISRGEMIVCDTQAAALMLYSSLLMLGLHQRQLNGAQAFPIDCERARAHVCAAFLRAYEPARARAA